MRGLLWIFGVKGMFILVTSSIFQILRNQNQNLSRVQLVLLQVLNKNHEICCRRDKIRLGGITNSIMNCGVGTFGEDTARVIFTAGCAKPKWLAVSLTIDSTVDLTYAGAVRNVFGSRVQDAGDHVTIDRTRV